jgi:hypothetical protein
MYCPNHHHSADNIPFCAKFTQKIPYLTPSHHKKIAPTHSFPPGLGYNGVAFKEVFIDTMTVVLLREYADCGF